MKLFVLHTLTQHKKVRGFTLLEVLIALTFFALIGMVLQQVTASTVGQYHTVRLKTYAAWIAENKLAEMRLSGSLPSPKEYKEEIDYANLAWQTISKVISTENPDIHRVEIEVHYIDDETNDKRKQLTMTGFVGRY